MSVKVSKFEELHVFFLQKSSVARALRISRRRLSPAAWGKMKVTCRAVIPCKPLGDVKKEEKEEDNDNTTVRLVGI